jgi:very-short-patch-repair endonuclease
MDRKGRSASLSVHDAPGGSVVDRRRQAVRLAGGQRGLVTHDQLLALGFHPRAIARAVRNGWLHPLHRGVYLVGHAVPPPLALELAALFYCGPTAALSHMTAAILWRILPSRSGPVELTVPDRRCRPRPTLRPHFASLPDQDVTTRQGLRLTTPARTLKDLRAALDLASLERVRDEAEVLGLVAPRTDRPGITRSEAERRLHTLLRRAGLPPTKTNTIVNGHEVDVLYAGAKLILEVDGYAFHRTRRAFERDRRRDAELIAAGYRVMRITWRQLTDEPEALIARVARSLP